METRCGARALGRRPGARALALLLLGAAGSFAIWRLLPLGSSPAEHAAFIKTEIEKWRKVAQSAGIQPE